MTKDEIESQTPILSARGIYKSYGNVTAIDGADFDLYPGEILAVIGDNGAGKSSLIKVLSGATIPDKGTISLDGEEVHFKSPLEARRAGIETVYQDLAVAPALDIATNLFLGREKRRGGPAGQRAAHARPQGPEGGGREADEEPADRHPLDEPGGGDALGRPAPGRRGGESRRVGAQAGDHGRADRRARRQGVGPGARADQARARQRAAGDPDQPQHAARVRDRGPHPHPPARQARGRGRSEGALDARGRGHHDRRRGARHRAHGPQRKRSSIPKDAPPPTPEEERANAERERNE